MKYIKLKLVACVITLLMVVNVNAQTQIFVAPNGNDSNSGEIDSPLKTLIGARDKVRSIKATGLPAGGIVVNFRDGRYPVTETCTMESQDSGESGNPIVYRAYGYEEVIFDGSVFVNSSKFEVTSSEQSGILHATAVGNVYAQKIYDIGLSNLLSENTAQLSMDDKMMTVARFPNNGFGHVNDATIDASGETFNGLGTEITPLGAKFKMVESFDVAKWSNELQRMKKAVVVGYIASDWKKDNLRIYTVADNGEIHLMDGTSYGLRDRTSPNRCFVAQMLCELDEPGEWYFDSKYSILYIWPFEPITAESKIGVWAGPEMVRVDGAEYINFERMTIQCLGKGVNGDGALNFRAGSNFKVAGVTFRYIASPLLPCNFWGDVSNSIMLSCDFFDNTNNTRLYGGSYTSTGTIIPGNNTIENCHFTQIYSKDLYGKASGISGVGNTFRNNLVHNMNGQPITHAGFDHLLELNEVFNVGIEEGDGGAFYTGNDVVSYGNVIRHNFMHHIMSVPKLLGRAAFFSDDYDGGELVEENVLYKGGWESIKMNKGAGHTVRKNVLLDCYTAIRQGNGGSSGYNSSMNYINGSNAESNDKNNYIGRMLKKVGVSGWENGLTEGNWDSRIEPFWKNRYPTFGKVMDLYSSTNTMNAFECLFTGNMFWSNKTNIYHGGSAAIEEGSQSIDLTLFEDPDNMNFKFKSPRQSFAPDIPFEKIGLYADDYRCSVPDKNSYRRAVKQHFEHLACHTSDAYEPETINERLYYNTGKLLLSLVPCQNSYVQTEFKFDFGTTTSPIYSGYERVSENTAPGLFGWTNNDGIQSVDRVEITGIDVLRRDIIYSSETKIFEVSIPNGTYKVLISFGDLRYKHDKMAVKAEGELKLSDISTAAGNNYLDKEFEVLVADDKLTLEFSDEGGDEPNWAVARVVISTNSILTSNAKPILFNEIKFFPNPVSDFLNIRISDAYTYGSSNLVIYNCDGKAVLTDQMNGAQKQLGVQALKAGLYFIQIKNDEGVSTRKFIKK